MIRTAKQTLEAVTVTASRKPEFTKLRLQRLMSSVANIINDRPFGIYLNNIGKFDAARLIRPNDLILGRSSGNISELVDFELITTPEQADYTKLIAMNKAFIDQWYTVWYKQVFPTLIPRSKWTESTRGVQINDIVLIRDTNLIRNQWRWGEVASESRSLDGITRTVSIRYKVENKTKIATKSTRDLVVILQNNERSDI
jgi:hypothetical protein